MSEQHHWSVSHDDDDDDEHFIVLQITLYNCWELIKLYKEIENQDKYFNLGFKTTLQIKRLLAIFCDTQKWMSLTW
jgi:hypothetical protein